MEFDWVFLSFYLVLLGFMWFHEVLWDFYVVLLVFIRFSWVFTWFHSVWLRVWGIYCLIYHLVHNGDSVATPDDVTELIGPQSGEGLAAISIGHRPNGSIHIVKKKERKKMKPHHKAPLRVALIFVSTTFGAFWLDGKTLANEAPSLVFSRRDSLTWFRLGDWLIFLSPSFWLWWVEVDVRGFGQVWLGSFLSRVPVMFLFNPSFMMWWCWALIEHYFI